MSYHNSSSSYSPPATSQRQAAPPGYHYMPDGSLMLDSQMVTPPSTPLATPLPEDENLFEEPLIFESSVGDGGFNTARLASQSIVLIKSLIMDESEMPLAETTRQFTVIGTVGSQFTMHITQEDTIKYYDFVEQTFNNGHVGRNNNLVVTLLGGNYSNNIVFPSGGGTYNITLTPLLGTLVSGGYNVLNRKISKQASNPQITFKAFTANTNNYATFPTSTSSGSLNSHDTFDFNWDITNASTDAGGFGLIPTNNFKDLNLIKNSWFFTTTETVDGAVAPSDSNLGLIVKVDDLTDIGVGSYISAVSAGSLVGSPVVTNINTATKEITLNTAQTFANNITLTFRADGVTAIEKAIGVKMTFNFGKLDEEKFKKTNKLVKTVRAGSSGTTVNLNGTYGVGHNDTSAFISGVGITTATVVSVSASSGAGSMVVSVSQGTLTVGTSILFDNIVQVFNVFGNIRIFSYPSANQDIYLDIDKFLTPGTAS